MGGKIIAALSFGNESTQFYIFQRYFLDAQFLTHDILENLRATIRPTWRHP